MSSRRAVCIASCIAAITSTLATPAAADAARDAQFFQSVAGKWRGPGEIVAGKYKGTKFTCDFNGATTNNSQGMDLKGACRVGVFTQEMEASITSTGKGYKGTFLDGALGEGLDVVAGNITDDRGVFTLKRKQLNGAMLVRKADKVTLNVTVSVRVSGELVPVIGMSMKRVDGGLVGAIK